MSINAPEAVQVSLKDKLNRSVTKARELVRAVESNPNDKAQLDVLSHLHEPTGHHTRRVGFQATLIAIGLDLEDRVIQRIARLGTLHDVGKIDLGLENQHILTTNWQPHEMDQNYAIISKHSLDGQRRVVIEDETGLPIAYHHSFQTNRPYPHFTEISDAL